MEAEAEPTMDVESAVMRQPSHQAGLSRPSMAASDVANAERSAVLEQPPERQDAMADLLALFGDDSASVSPETPPTLRSRYKHRRLTLPQHKISH